MTLSPDELESAYRRLEKPLHNYLYRWFWDPRISEDLIHDVFERIWRRRSKVESESLDALIWAALVNLARSRYRRAQRWKWAPLPGALLSLSNPESVALSDERDSRLRSAMYEIPESAREALLLEMHSGMSRGEIARCLNIPEGTLASRKHNAVKRLQVLLKVSDNEV